MQKGKVADAVPSFCLVYLDQQECSEIGIDILGVMFLKRVFFG